MDKKTIAGTIAGVVLGAGAMASVPNKQVYDIPILNRDDVRIQVLIREPNFNDAIYYTKEEAQEKTDEQVDVEKHSRKEAYDAFVAEQSKKITEEIVDEKSR